MYFILYKVFMVLVLVNYNYLDNTKITLMNWLIN